MLFTFNSSETYHLCVNVPDNANFIKRFSTSSLLTSKPVNLRNDKSIKALLEQKNLFLPNGAAKQDFDLLFDGKINLIIHRIRNKLEIKRTRKLMQEYSLYWSQYLHSVLMEIYIGFNGYMSERRHKYLHLRERTLVLAASLRGKQQRI